jgi:chromatin accessibility complex protein 1
MYLSKLAQRNGEDQNSVNYTDLASVVLRKDSMEFLHDIIPKKIKYSEYLRLVEEENDEDDDLF